MSKNREIVYSIRGIPLVYMPVKGSQLYKKSVVTVENYIKWYSLFVVKNGLVYPLDFWTVAEFLEKGDYATPSEIEDLKCEGILGDHIINPKAVALFATANNMMVDEVSEEVMRGRWVMEG